MRPADVIPKRMASFKNLWKFLTETIFLKDERNYRNGLIRWSVRQYKLLFYTARGLKEHDTLVRSAALTFYTLMSIVPIAALVFALVKGFGLAEGLMQNLYSVFPHNREAVDYIIAFADKAIANAQGGVVAFVGIIMLFWAVVRVFGSVEEAFNNIWEVKVTRGFTRQFTDYIAVVVVTPILWVIGSTVGRYAGQVLGIEAIGPLYTLLSSAASLLVIWAMFTFIYVVVPNTRVRWSCALPAGILAGTLFLLFQWGYVGLQRYMTSYNAIYGSFAALPLFLIWVQWSWQILLFGGELTFAYQNISRFAEERESLHISYDHRRQVTLAVMLHVARIFRDGHGPVSARRDPYGAAAAHAYRQRRPLFAGHRAAAGSRAQRDRRPRSALRPGGRHPLAHALRRAGAGRGPRLLEARLPRLRPCLQRVANCSPTCAPGSAAVARANVLLTDI